MLCSIADPVQLGIHLLVGVETEGSIESLLEDEVGVYDAHCCQA